MALKAVSLTGTTNYITASESRQWSYWAVLELNVGPKSAGVIGDAR